MRRLRPCAEPRCPIQVEGGYCDAHRRDRDQGIRGTAAQRGYDAEWQEFSRQRRMRLPWCGQRADGSFDTVHSRCAAARLFTRAQCTDHVIPLSQGGAKYDEANLMSACIACNTWKASTLERQR